MQHSYIAGSPFLTILEVSENEIGDDGIEACVHHINNVIRLSLEFCGFSVKGNSVHCVCILLWWLTASNKIAIAIINVTNNVELVCSF